MRSVLFGLLAGAILPAGAIAADACLPGRWAPQGHGAAEWMARNAPGMKVQVQQQQGAMVFKADGTYTVAQAVRGKVQPSANVPAGTMQSEFQSRGRWRAQGGTLVLEPEQGASAGKLDMQGRSTRTRMAMPNQTSRVAYSCSGDRMETRMQMPGHKEPIVQRFQRAR